MGISKVGSNELGSRIAELREKSGIKQGELARQVTWSPAVLSRVEAGDRELSDDELKSLLTAIGTPEAAALSTIVSRRWHYLETPPLNHADQDLLWKAEEVAAELALHSHVQNTRPAFQKRLDEYLAEIKSKAELLLKRKHDVALIGPIGIGKSTAICKATGLEVASDDGQRAPVLETGGGGITLCEVSLKVGPQYGVIVTPRTSEEIRADVTDFADQLVRQAEGQPAAKNSDDVHRAVPREIERAIRNMSGLRPSRTKGPDGKAVRTDPAKELAAKVGSSRELVVDILSRMELPRRDRREIWLDPSSANLPLAWLKKTFEQINNGRHPDFSLPAHVDLIVPTLMDTGDLTVNIIDTRGIDQPIARADLETHLLDPHTVSVLCTGFNDAPEQSVQHLLERAREIGNQQIDTHSAVLVLPRPGEALAVKDESGVRAENDDEGYELKAEQVGSALAPYGLETLSTQFFNAFSDDPRILKSFLLGQIEKTREGFRAQLITVLENAQQLLVNIEQEQVFEVQRDASRHVEAWLKAHVTPPSIASHVHETLMTEIGMAHASTLNAAIRREGEWYSLSYSHQLGFGARRVAVQALRDWRTEFVGICQNLLITHPDAAELLSQARRLMDQSYEDLLKKLQVAGAALYREELQRAQILWMELNKEWGLGSGYRDRVTLRQSAWFEEKSQAKIEEEILGVLNREWETARKRVSAIFDAG